MIALESGIMIWIRMRNSPAPSIRADSLMQGVDALEEGPEKNQVISCYHEGNYHNQRVVDKMQLLHQKVSRDRTAAEEHCDGDENGDSFFSRGKIL